MFTFQARKICKFSIKLHLLSGLGLLCYSSMLRRCRHLVTFWYRAIVVSGLPWSTSAALVSTVTVTTLRQDQVLMCLKDLLSIHGDTCSTATTKFTYSCSDAGINPLIKWQKEAATSDYSFIHSSHHQNHFSIKHTAAQKWGFAAFSSLILN